MGDAPGLSVAVGEPVIVAVILGVGLLDLELPTLTVAVCVEVCDGVADTVKSEEDTVV